jgi:ABC-type dipeptide/oligopeptide/nickel transport system ATPase subunit
MKAYSLTLQSPVSNAFRCVKAANSLDIDATKKSIHAFNVNADIDAPYNLGLIVGASGSGKTTFAKHAFGNERFKEILDLAQPVIEQFPAYFDYDACASMLSGVGLTSVPCWIRPAHTLSNGQRARAECALQMARADNEVIVIDEWTSVVDRTVARVMSHCIAKHARATNKRIVLLSCHYDVIEWLNPDWIIDCNNQSFIDRRSLWRTFERTEKLSFEIRPASRDTWRMFSRYHYLSESFPGGYTRVFGLFHGEEQIGFQCFANYVPHRKGTRMKLHSNRVVIHPDYCGFGLGLRMTDACAQKLCDEGFEVYAKFSSVPMYQSRIKSRNWRLEKVMRHHKIVVGGNMLRKTGFRTDVKTYSFKFLPNQT